MQNAWLDEAQAGIKIAGRNINNLRYADDTTLMAESKELESLDEGERRVEKVGLKLNIQKLRDTCYQIYYLLPTALFMSPTLNSLFWRVKFQ